MQGKACGSPVSREGWEDPLALFLILEVPVGLQMWHLHVGQLLGRTFDGPPECPESLRGSPTASLSNEFIRLRVDMVGLSETRRPGSGETSNKDFSRLL